MGIKVIQVTRQIVDRGIDTSDYTPCCTAWTAEFGRSIITAPNVAGILPDNLFKRFMLMGEFKFKQLIKPWNYCPYCGRAIAFELIEGDQSTVVTGGTAGEPIPRPAEIALEARHGKNHLYPLGFQGRGAWGRGAFDNFK
jgi:hypothetical protein